MGQAEPRRPHAGGDRTSTCAGRTRARSGPTSARSRGCAGSAPAIPDYPWLFGVDGEYTAHASVALGQFEAIEDHLRALRDISDQLSDRSGVVVHEVVADGSIYFGKRRTRDEPGRRDAYDFNTDEILKFPAAVALVWRWSGDDRFRDEMLDFMGRGLDYVATKLDDDGDGWPQGNGNVERPGMGPEKLDNAVYYIRALYDYADMARSARA